MTKEELMLLDLPLTGNGNLTRRPAIVRHCKWGVWIGYISGDEATSDNSLRFEGRHIWHWQGGKRLELSQVAKYGCSSEDTLGEWETVEFSGMTTDLVEIHVVEESVVEHAKTLKTCGKVTPSWSHNCFAAALLRDIKEIKMVVGRLKDNK